MSGRSPRARGVARRIALRTSIALPGRQRIRSCSFWNALAHDVGDCIEVCVALQAGLVERQPAVARDELDPRLTSDSKVAVRVADQRDVGAMYPVPVGHRLHHRALRVWREAEDVGEPAAEIP